MKEERSAKTQDGIECPSCGCRHLPVVYTRHRPQRTVRVRRCRHCGRRVITIEQVSGRGENTAIRASMGG